jgi:hypothetical protein
MAAAFSITKCYGCGQLNRHPDAAGKSGTFTCGKCGKQLLSVVAAKPAKPSAGAWAPLSVLAIVIVGGVIYAWSENQRRGQPAPPVSAAKENTAPAPQQRLPAVAAARPIAVPTLAPSSPMASIPQNPIPNRPPPPPQSLDISPADLARNQAARPSAPAAPAKPASEPPPATVVPAKDLKVVPAPPTGTIQSRLGRGAIAPFKIVTDSGSNYYVKLVNLARPREQIAIFVRGGETFETKMPLGEYKFRGAAGPTWYGRDDMFGPGTRFFGLRAKSGRLVSETLVLNFSRDGRRISGHAITLKPVVEGNLEQEAMSKAEFDAD